MRGGTLAFVVVCAWPASALAGDEQNGDQNEQQSDPRGSSDENAAPSSSETNDAKNDARNDAKNNAKKDKKKDEEKEWKQSCAFGDETTVKPFASTGCSAIGLRFAFTSLDVPKTGLYAGAMFASQGEDFGRWHFFSVRATHKDGIGGGGAGLEGEVGGSLTVGVRIPFGRKQGPIARVGIAGHVMGNDTFYSSRIELPRSELGYQYWSGVVVVEAGATMGYVIDGRYGQRIPPPPFGISPHTPLAGFEVGGYLAVQVPHVRMGVAMENVPLADNLKGNVLMGTASACLVGYVFAVCGDLRTFGQDGLFGNATRSTYYGGITLGLTSMN